MQPPAQYTVLNLGFVSAAMLQGAAGLLAASHGVDVNWDGALWGPLYGTALLSLLYGLAAACSFDWGALGYSVLGLLGALLRVLTGAIEAFVFKRDWLLAGRR